MNIVLQNNYDANIGKIENIIIKLFMVFEKIILLGITIFLNVLTLVLKIIFLFKNIK